MKTIHHGVDAKHDLSRLSEVQIARRGVEVLSTEDLTLRCVACNATWTAPVDCHGSLLDGWWLCPNRCNL